MTAERILVLEDELEMRELLLQDLRKRGFEVIGLGAVPSSWDEVAQLCPSLIIADINLPGTDGLTFCARARELAPEVPVIVITAFGSLETAVAAIRAGAYDFVTKPFELGALSLVVARALEHRRLIAEVRQLRFRAADLDAVTGLLGESTAMRRTKTVVSRVAKTEASILIQGESGTGKEVAAREIHRLSSRAAGPFVAVNLAAMPAALIEGELFGHEKGAFTDARTSRRGVFAEANGGTLLLDEIGELPLELQPKLLRALEERRVRPLGSTGEVEFDARIVACTNRDLTSAAAEGRFRQDLLYRLNVIEIEMPPLRVRGRDILALAQIFIDRFSGKSAGTLSLAPQTARKLLAYPWPGNVRELRNCIEHAVALAETNPIAVVDLPGRIANFEDSHVIVASDNPEDLASLEEVERRYILRVLDAVGGNKTLAAKVLGLGRKTLYRKLDAYADHAATDEGN